MCLPEDDFILLSLINTKLRDIYPTFSQLCEEEGVDSEEVVSRLENLGYSYDVEANAFKRK